MQLVSKFPQNQKFRQIRQNRYQNFVKSAIFVTACMTLTCKILVKEDKKYIKFSRKGTSFFHIYSVAQLFVRFLVYAFRLFFERLRQIRILSLFYSKIPSFAAAFIEYGHVESFEYGIDISVSGNHIISLAI